MPLTQVGSGGADGLSVILAYAIRLPSIVKIFTPVTKNKMEEGERNENTTSTSCIFCTCGVFNCMCALIGLYGMTIYISPPENLWR